MPVPEIVSYRNRVSIKRDSNVRDAKTAAENTTHMLMQVVLNKDKIEFFHTM
jgi:hypothetical protein